MLLPPILPLELDALRKISDENELFTQLVQKTPKLILFFEAISNDEVWIQRHPEFIEKIIAWLTQQYFQDRLDDETAFKAARNIHKHYSSFRPLIPMTITLLTDNQKYPVNALLFGTASPLFKELLQSECRDKNKTTLRLANVHDKVMKEFTEFVMEGTLENLWKQNREEILEMIHQADDWQMQRLSLLGQESMQRYIDKERVIPTLIEAQKEHWTLLKESCIGFFNTLGYGIELRKRGPDDLAVEFMNFRLLTMEVFKPIAPVVTHLICPGDLAMEREFPEVVKMCPKLRSVEVSEGTQFGDWFRGIPSTVEELILARCSWLNTGTLKMFISWFPGVKRWDLTSALQLDYNAWAELQKLGNLAGLVLADCHQLQDTDLQLLLRSCLGIKELDLEGCRALTDAGFKAIGRSNLRLSKLNLSRTKLNDAALFDIVSHMRSLEEINLIQCPLSSKCLASLSRDYPRLKVIVKID